MHALTSNFALAKRMASAIRQRAAHALNTAYRCYKMAKVYIMHLLATLKEDIMRDDRHGCLSNEYILVCILLCEPSHARRISYN
eukprot:scaffold195173_cov36-Prasinocladus_malaysianus.AAC.1